MRILSSIQECSSVIRYDSVCFLMIRRPPRSTRTDTLFPYTTLFRSTEERIAAELDLGRHADAVAELETLTRAHPLRERLWGELMLSLYRSEEHTSELQSLMRTSYAVFCLKKKTYIAHIHKEKYTVCLLMNITVAHTST